VSVVAGSADQELMAPDKVSVADVTGLSGQ